MAAKRKHPRAAGTKSALNGGNSGGNAILVFFGRRIETDNRCVDGAAGTQTIIGMRFQRAVVTHKRLGDGESGGVVKRKRQGTHHDLALASLQSCGCGPRVRERSSRTLGAHRTMDAGQ